jgi:hypothetical protein
LSLKRESDILYLKLSIVDFGRRVMALSILPLLVAVEDKFIRAPGLEEVEEETFFPGEQSLSVVADGMFSYLNTGFVTLIVLPVLAVVLYQTGFRVAGPLLALFTLGLFLARMLGTPA